MTYCKAWTLVNRTKLTRRVLSRLFPEHLGVVRNPTQVDEGDATSALRSFDAGIASHGDETLAAVRHGEGQLTPYPLYSEAITHAVLLFRT